MARLRLFATLAVAATALLGVSAQAEAATKTFSSSTQMLRQFPGDTAGDLIPFPSVIDASGMTGTVTSVRVTVRGIAFQSQQDLLMLLAGPGGRRGLLMGNVCSGQDTTVAPLTLTFAAGSPAVPLTAVCLSGRTYSPTLNFITAPSFFYPFPGPQPVGFGQFPGSPPNGSWQLYAADFNVGAQGSIPGGWSIEITTTNPKKCKKKKSKKGAAAAKKKKGCGKKKK